MKKLQLLIALFALTTMNIVAQACIDTASNSLTILSKSSFGGPDCLFSVRFCVIKTSTEAKEIDYQVTATYGTMTRTINVGFLPVGSVICETFTFVADCNSSANFVAYGINANDDVCGVVVDFIILPIRLMEFTADKTSASTAALNWKTGVESNSSHFVIQQSVDGRNFREVSKVRAAGNSRAELNYSQDVRLVANQVNYFRLSMVDKDGTSSFSNIVTVGNRGGRAVLSPIPTQGLISVDGDYDQADLNSMSIYDMTGRKMTGFTKAGRNQIDISNLTDGVYYVKIGEYTEKIIKE